MEAQRSRNDPCTYKGLSVLQPHLRTAVVGLRVASLCLWIITNGMPLATYESMMHWIDSWWPGEVGEINHSKNFLVRFRNSAVRTLRKMQRWDFASILPALRIPSDIALVSDGVSTSSGTPLHAHILLQEGRGSAGIQFNLIGMQPVTSVAQDEACATSASGLHFSDKSSLLHHSESVLKQFGLDPQALRMRFACRVGDGAEEGPTGSKLGAAQAQRLGLTPPQIFGNLDVYHSVETACGHADALCFARGITFHEQFRKVMKQARARFHFGALAMLPKEKILSVSFFLHSL